MADRQSQNARLQGSPCARCSGTERYANGHRCVACQSARRPRSMKIKLEPAASRAEAIKLGRVHYYGAPCKRCGGTKRYKQSWGCVACAIAASTARQHGLREAKWLPNGEPVPAGWVEREPLGHHAHYGRLICRQVPA